MSSLAVLSPQNENKVSPKSDIDLRAQQIARENYVKRPRHATPSWEESSLAKIAATPTGHYITTDGAQWLHIVHNDYDFRNHRADFTQNIHTVCRILSEFIDYESGIIRLTWKSLAEKTGLSRRTIARILRILKINQLLTVIASGRSATKTPRGQKQQNLAPVYALLIPTPPMPKPSADNSYFHDEHGNLFITGTPSPLRDRKISYKQAITEGIFDSFCKQSYARYARTHKNSLEKKRQSLKADYSSQRQRKLALTHLARTVQHHCFDLRGISASAILEILTPFFEAGWTVRDVLYALEYSPAHQPYNTKNATGMRSVKKWLDLRMTQWTQQGQILPSRTAVEEQDYRQRQAERTQAKEVSKKVTAPSVDVKRHIKVALLGEKKARHQFPELF